jgi:hypothetical protein
MSELSIPPSREVHREGDGTLECQNGSCPGGRHGLVLAGWHIVAGTGR